MSKNTYAQVIIKKAQNNLRSFNAPESIVDLLQKEI